jgi:lysophospholipase L1-like esterase
MPELRTLVEAWRSQPDEGARVVAFGASNTEVSWHSLGRHGWAAWLECALREWVGRHVSMTNCGVSGNTSEQALARLERDVLPHRPACVVITLGGNDVAGVPKAEFIENLTSIATRLRDAGSTPVFQTYYAFDYRELDGAHSAFPAYMTAVVALADELGVASIDQHAWFWPWYRNDREGYMPVMLDAKHLRPVGNAIMGTLAARSFGVPDPVMPPDIARDVKRGLEQMARFSSLPAAIPAPAN